jgi:hypothetical protein
VDWLNNPWVVGILGGILSGLVVTVISRRVLGKRENREYLQKVLSANREVVYGLRPHVSEGVMPTPEVVDALIAATARKFGVTAGDLYGRREIGEELIKEVMDSSFIPATRKEEYCKLLAGLGAPPIPATVDQPEVAGFETMAAVSERREARARAVTLMSVMAGALTMMMTFMMVVLKEVPTRLFPPGSEIILSMAAAVFALLMSMAVTMIYFRTTRRRLKDSVITGEVLPEKK